MLKKLILKYGKVIVIVTLLVDRLAVNLACSGPFYQEKVLAQ